MSKILRLLAILAGALGLALVGVATAGRFSGGQTVELFGHLHKPLAVLLAANTAMLVGVFLLLLSGPRKEP